MNKVIVIGCPGSGKTYFSRELAKITGLPLIHLDATYHQDRWSTDPAIKKQQWSEWQQGIVTGDRWIIDGNYKGTFSIRMPVADTIIFLDYPRWLTLYRSFARRWQYRKALRPDMPAEWKEHLSWNFFCFIWTYRSKEKPKVLALLREHQEGRDIVILDHPQEANRFLQKMALQSSEH